MAKKKAGGKRANSKSAAIREALAAKAMDAASKDIIAAVAERGITVSSAHVSNVRSRLQERKKRRGRKPRVARAVSGGSPSGNALEQTLMDAKRLVDKVGSVDGAKKAL